MTGVKLLVVCHGSGVDQNIQPTGATHPESTFVHAAYQEGWTVVSPYLHGDQWGNAQQMTDLTAMLVALQARHPTIERTVIHGTSMGGATAFNALLNSVLPNVKGVYLNDGAVNLQAFFSNVTGQQLGTAYNVSYGSVATGSPITAGQSSFQSTVSYPAGARLQIEAYLSGSALNVNYEQVTVAPAGPSGTGPYTIPIVGTFAHSHVAGASVSDFPTRVGTSDPMAHPASDFPNIRYRFLVSDADTTVYRAYAGDAMASKLTGKLESNTAVHLATHASQEGYWPHDFIAFLRRCAAD